MLKTFALFCNAILFTTVFWGIYTTSLSQDIGHFNQFSISSGLSQSSITAICRDQSGFIWFGTQEGLNRYNGKTNKIFSFIPFSNKGMSGNGVYQLLSAKNGKILALTGSGIDQVDPFDFTINHLIEFKKEKLFRRVYLFWELDSTLYLSTNSGVYKFSENKENRFEKIISAESSQPLLVFCFIKLNDKILLGTNNGLFYYSAGDSSLSFINGSAQLQSVMAFAQDGNSVIFNNGNQVYRLKENGIEQIYSCKANITALAFDANKDLWIGTDGQGIEVLRKKEKAGDFLPFRSYREFSGLQYGLKANYINCLLTDTVLNPSNIWIGSRDAGAFCYNLNKNIFRIISHEIKLPENNFFAVIEDKDLDLWISSNENIYLVNENNSDWKKIRIGHLVEKAGRPVEAMYCDSLNNIWFGIGDAFYKIDKKNLSFKTVIAELSGQKRNHVLKVIGIPGNKLLIGSGECLTVYNTENGSYENINSVTVNSNKVVTKIGGALFCDNKKRWWFRVPDGLICYDPFSMKAELFSHNPTDITSIISNTILDINQLSSGEMIIGTLNGFSILKDFDKKKFQNFPKSENLGNSVIYSVITDAKDKVWMSTNFGIYHFDPVNNSIMGFNSANGSFIDEFNSGVFCRKTNGDLLFGGIGGVILVDPDSLYTIATDLPVYAFAYSSDGFKIYNNSSVTGTISVDHNKNDINFFFETPCYFDAGSVQLKYRINDDTAWHITADDYSLRLVNLSPGSYNLVVKAEDKLGRYNFAELTIPVSVKPPFWKTNWFYGAGAAFLLSLIFALYRYNLSRKIKLMQYAEQIRNQENEKVRKAAALDLHDEFGNGLTRISMLVEMVKEKIGDSNKEANDLLRLVSENSSRLYQGTKDFIWSINPANDSLLETAVRIKDFADEICSGTNMTFHFSGLEDNLKKFRFPPSVNRNIAMIFKEALANTVKHSEAAKVILEISTTPGTCIICLKDDGKGFITTQKKRGYGISNMQTRANKIKAVLNINSSVQQGTAISLTLNNLNYEFPL